MLKENIYLPRNGSNAAEFVLTGTSTAELKRSLRGSTLGLPRYMVIKHQTAGTKDQPIDRHLVSFVHTLLDSAQKPHAYTVNLTVSVPRVVADPSVVQELLNFVVGFLRSDPDGFGDPVSAIGAFGAVNPDIVAAVMLGES